MQTEATDDVALYIPPEKPWMLRLRSTETFQARLEGVVRLWRMLAESQGLPSKGIDISYVVRRILDAGIDQAFQEFGGEPKDEAGWDDIAKAIAKSAKKSR